MKQGRLVYNQLSAANKDLLERLSSQQRQLATANKQESDLNQNLFDHYKRLAGFYLTEIDANRLDKHFDSTATKVAGLLEKRDENKAENQASLAAVKMVIQSLETKHEQQVNDRDNAADAYELKMIQVKDAFLKTDEYGNLQEEVDSLMSRHHKASERLAETTADRNEKRQPYESDKIFAYLLKVKYGTASYGKKGLIRLCDGWLADFIDFNKAYKNYQLLVAIPDRLAGHVDHLKADIDKARKAIDDHIEKRFCTDGGLLLRERLDRCEDELQETVEDLSEKREQATSFQNSIADSEAGIDEYTRQALDIQRQALEAEHVTDLWQRARETKTDRDDKMVKRIGELRERLQNIKSDIRHGEQTVFNLQKRGTNVNKLLREFQRRDWDSSYSNFTNSIKINNIVRDLTEGNLDVDQVLHKLAKAQQFKYRHTQGGWPNTVADELLRELQRSTRFPMTGRGRGGFGSFSGGFRGGGGFGGGSFKTGGGF